MNKPAPEVSKRPTCPNCHKPLRPVIHRVQERRELTGSQLNTQIRYVTVGREWTGKYHGYGAFCTLRCTEQFANAAYSAGYRRKA